MKNKVFVPALVLILAAILAVARVGMASANRESILKNSINQMDYNESSHTVHSEIQNYFAH